MMKNDVKIIFNYSLYDCIWRDMMDIIENWCLEWFASQISLQNVEKTLKYDEIYVEN